MPPKKNSKYKMLNRRFKNSIKKKRYCIDTYKKYPKNRRLFF